MVQVSEALPLGDDGRIDIDAWCARCARTHPGLKVAPLADAARHVEQLAGGAKLLERGMLLADLVATLTTDTSALLAALLYRSRRERCLDREQIERRYSVEVANLVESVEAMATASLLDLSNPKLLASERRDQVENIKRLLVSMVDDARVAVIKIAERVVVLRQAKTADERRRRRLAHEAERLFAPLAGRLGIWNLKWELEDLSLRYLEPDVYLDIARQLDGRRLDREEQVRSIVDELTGLLAAEGIRAVVSGRAKHIYSILRKMRSKSVPLDAVYDIRAVRVLVDDLAACYASLGVVHRRYTHIPTEFDDYIASPKDNGYRSIHTAVVGPDGKTLEVQIRTHDMHEEAERGVCAHWDYKGDGDSDQTFGAKMDWLRQVVDWHESVGGERALSDELQASFAESRIFVHTPKGHVIDLSAGATPLDFAYRVHTDVGHRCVGAVVDGVPVSLDAPLATGQRVQIRTDLQHGPERSWLEPIPAYVTTNRARSKILGWMRAQGEEKNRQRGQALLREACASMAVSVPGATAARDLCAACECEDLDAFWVALGCGDVLLHDALAHWLERTENLQAELDLPGSATPVYRLVLEADNRDGLLLDVSERLNQLGVSLHGLQGRVVSRDHAEITLDFASDALLSVYHVLLRLENVDGVNRASRAEFVRNVG